MQFVAIRACKGCKFESFTELNMLCLANVEVGLAVSAQQHLETQLVGEFIIHCRRLPSTAANVGWGQEG